MQIFKIFSFFLVFTSMSLFAQTTEGYKTERGESLKDVAKKFSIDYRDLVKANPNLSRWPKQNTLVKIPKKTLSFDEAVEKVNDSKLYQKSELINNKEQDTTIVHIVKAKETLYSLSKLYNVPISHIIKENVVLSVEGLKIGQELKISYKKEVVQVSNTHIVKPKETWYGISKLYNVSIEELKGKNPEIASSGLKIGSALEIPDLENSSMVLPINEKVIENSHIISKGETLYSVSRSYGIGVDELLAVNDTVIVDSLVIGTVLQLPKNVIESVVESTAIPFYKQSPVFYKFEKSVDTLEVVLDDYMVSKDSLLSLNPLLDSIVNYGGELLMGFEKTHQLFGEREWFKDSIVTNQSIKAMLMLPFDFKKNDTLTQEQLFSNVVGLPTYVSEFYMGVEIAIDSLKKQGVGVSLDVVDTEKSVDSIHKNIDNFKALEPDVILGPLYSSNAKYVASQFSNTPVYYPVYSKKQSTFSNKNLITTVTDKKLYENEIISYIKENRRGEHLLIVGLNESRLTSIKKELSKKDDLGKILEEDVSVLALSEDNYISDEEFLEKIILDKPNWVLIADKNVVLTAGVFNNILNIPEENRETTSVRVIAFEKSEEIKKLSYQSLSTYHYTYATDEVEYDEVVDSSFEQAYFKKNNNYPTKHAIRGFDVTYDAVLRVLKTKTEGSGLYNPSCRTKTAFDYEKDGEKTNMNQSVFVNTIENTLKEGLKIIRLR